MEIGVFGAFRNFSVENLPSPLQIEHDFILSYDQSFLASVIVKRWIEESVGILDLESLIYSVYVYRDLDLYKNENLSLIDLENILENSWGPLQLFLLSLWFVKDNSVNCESLYLYESQKRLVFKNRRNVWFSDSKGHYKESVFSQEELQTALIWKSKLLKYFILDEEITPEVHDAGTVTYRNKGVKTPYSNMDRFARALRFITVGRKESFLPMKISAYVGALEALFSTSNGEVSHQVAERTTKILGGDIEEKLVNYNLIKKVYDIRSQYVHGSEINDKTLRKIPELTKELDELIRNVMRILIEDYPHLSNMKKEELGLWFKKLILQ
ncbi:HEPN domain-containing protein [Bacillus anthracis]|uniref:HEPN domain-containing protein n=1 Tax=Bacillus anthracis TaxID=1392 RepID=UPI0008FEA508|nr:HEPN domain-containing protein [Bacillus anthracis]AXO97171.1 hypothetical protein DY470_05355 [Bacillus anthracis]OJD84755.1 hypothetical protein A9486_22870 [Bacillus anthracis]